MDNICRIKDHKIQNEAELRFCIGDPILCAICDAWGYKARLEESVKSQSAAEQPGSSAAQQPASTSQQAAPSTPPSVSRSPFPATGTPGRWLQKDVIKQQSKADYTVYLIRNEANDVISVIIEAKHTTNSALRHVLAQLIGYFAAYEIPFNTPLAFVLTEKYVQPVIFPFNDETDHHLFIN